MKNSIRKIGSPFDPTEMLRQGLEGRSFKATLRLYLSGLCALGSVAAIVVLLFSSQELFLITPLLAVVLVGSQYFVCYGTKGRLIKSLKNHRAFNFSLDLAGLLITLGIVIGFIAGYEETIIKIIVISLGPIAAIWLFWDDHKPGSVLNWPVLKSVLVTLTGAVAIIAIIQLITMSIQFGSSDRKVSTPTQTSSSKSTQTSSSKSIEGMREYSEKIKPPRSNDELSITNLYGSTARETLLVEGIGATPTADVWVVVHPLSTNDYWVQSPALVTSSGEWSATVHLGNPNDRRYEDFEIMAVSNPEPTLEEGMMLSDWPDAEQRSEVSLVTLP